MKPLNNLQKVRAAVMALKFCTRTEPAVKDFAEAVEALLVEIIQCYNEHAHQKGNHSIWTEETDFQVKS